MCYLKDRLPKKFSIAFHKGSNYDYHFIIKELAEELELAEVNINITTVFLKTQTLKMISQNTNVWSCNKNDRQKFDEKLNERFFDTYKYSNNDNNKFILLLQKGG